MRLPPLPRPFCRSLTHSCRLITSADRRLSVEHIKKHPFFYGVDWEAIRLIDAPFVPRLRSITDTSYFPTDELEQAPEEPAGPDNSGANKDLAFLGYVAAALHAPRSRLADGRRTGTRSSGLPSHHPLSNLWAFGNGSGSWPAKLNSRDTHHIVQWILLTIPAPATPVSHRRTYTRHARRYPSFFFNYLRSRSFLHLIHKRDLRSMSTSQSVAGRYCRVQTVNLKYTEGVDSRVSSP